MTQEDKELVLKNLCARLPYGVKCLHPKTKEIVIIKNLNLHVGVVDMMPAFKVEETKLYLRPMSSMTEEEQFQLGRLLGATSYNLLKGEYSSLKELLEYFYKNHIDLFGLIPKGLAIEAPEDMYK